MHCALAYNGSQGVVCGICNIVKSKKGDEQEKLQSWNCSRIKNTATLTAFYEFANGYTAGFI